MKFSRSPLTIVDLIPIVGTALSLLEYFLESESCVRVVRLLQLCWALKLFRYSRGLQELARLVWDAREDVLLLLQVWAVLAFFFSGLVFHVESGEPDSSFSSQWESMWFVTVTMFTVGYGDLTPVTGKERRSRSEVMRTVSVCGKVTSCFLAGIGASVFIIILVRIVVRETRQTGEVKYSTGL